MGDFKLRMMALGSMVSGAIIIALFVTIVVGIPYLIIKTIF
ncbi:MAG TPA: hypothetical protein PLB69_03465 [Smithellaceae bacterium]|nr:hypothetical protein [Smithellaceae bacterium]